MKRVLQLFLLLAFCIPTFALAETFRCDGYVQFHPCDQKSGLAENQSKLPPVYRRGDPKAQRIRARKVRWNTNSSSKILTQKFRKYSPRQGLWSGRLLGEGLVHLTLDIFREGKLVSSRYMGKVHLTAEDRDISFNFRAPIPAGTWSWRIRTT